MEWHINDLSLDGQFSSPQAFCEALETLLRFRMQHKALQENLFCSRNLGQRPIHVGHSLQQIVLKHRNPLFKRQVSEWLAKSRPFWDDSRVINSNDYFAFEADEVTEQGLGEACRRQLLGRSVASFSFTHHRFTGTPLNIQHGWREPSLDFGQVKIDNFWKIVDLIKVVESLKPEPTNWQEMLQESRQRFTGLIFADNIETVLHPHPFSRCVSQRVFDLLRVLQQLVDESDTQGSLSDTGMELYNQHFAGEKAWFSRSSDSEEREFKSELTFPDPITPSQMLFCSWHGKIKTPQFRVHFQWKRPESQREIKVVYIGPKITKR
jgi:hypothetical protein